MRHALDWFRLDWDDEFVQSGHRASHEGALDRLATLGVLYPCGCSRKAIQQFGERAADGGWRYPGTCRRRDLPKGGWRGVGEALRLRLEPGNIETRDEGNTELTQDPAVAMGDPVLRRGDGSIAYHLACVVDDAEQGVTRIIRGRDLAASTAIHVVLQRLLGLSTPTYRHHFLLLEEVGDKLAKLHGAVGWRELRSHYGSEELCSLLANLAGLQPAPVPIRPSELVFNFSWQRVRESDQVPRWTGRELVRPD